MENHWTEGYRAGMAGLLSDETRPVAYHFGFDEGRKDRNRRALVGCLKVADEELELEAADL